MLFRSAKALDENDPADKEILDSGYYTEYEGKKYKITRSMKHAMDETARRRDIQMAYNEEHGITPQTIKKEIRDLIAITKKTDSGELEEVDASAMNKKERKALVKKLEKEMQQAAAALDFEGAAQLRDMVLELRAMD